MTNGELELTKDAVIDLNDYTLNIAGDATNYYGINVLSGDVTVKNGNVTSAGWGFWLPKNSTAKLTLVDCNVSNGRKKNNAVAAFGGSLFIEGGEYNCTGAKDGSDVAYVIALKGNGTYGEINTKVNVNGISSGAITVLDGATANITGGEYHAKEWHALNINGSTVDYSEDVVFTTEDGMKHIQVYENASKVNGVEKAAGTQWDVE